MASFRRDRVVHMLRNIAATACRCPAHSNVLSSGYTHHEHFTSGQVTPPQNPKADYAFEMACSNIRFGPGVTKEVGMDFKNLGTKNVCVMTDPLMAKLPPMKAALESLTMHNVNFSVFEDVRIEPTDSSFKVAIEFAKKGNFDGFLAVGGGSVMDTCKAANLYASHPEAELLDFVNKPIGKGLPVTNPVKPLIAVPTTSGTGSETTGVAIFDLEEMEAKTGIGNRAIRPLLGLVDPFHTSTMAERVTANTAFDVLCHALESYTAIPFNQRQPRPENPINRPAYQGSNPISDIWSLQALRIFAKYGKRAIFDSSDSEARQKMLLASSFAGIGFGNAGVHLCHGLSYPISGLVKNYYAEDYPTDHPIVPHGLSVVITAPAVFKFTSPMCPERHLEAAKLLGADVTNAKREDAGNRLADRLREIMLDMNIDNGISAFGYTSGDIPTLVKGTLPQERVTKLSPRPQTEEDLASIFEDSLTVY